MSRYMLLLPSASDFNRTLIGSFSFTCFFGLAMMYEVLFCFCILLHWRVFLPLVESSCQIWFPMLTFAFLSLPLLRKTDVKIRKQTEKRETKRKQETVFYVFLRMSLANIGKFKLSLKALILSVFTFICFLVFSNVFCRTKIFLTSCSSLFIFIYTEIAPTTATTPAIA